MISSTQPLAITSGEPAGIGPDICLMLARKDRSIPFVVFADRALLQQRAQQMGLRITLQPYLSGQEVCLQAGQLSVVHVPLAAPCQAGTLNVANATYVLSMLKFATEKCINGEFSALVTAPVQKSVINDAGFPFSGHTEFLAKQCAVEKVVMMLAHSKLRVALVTTHLPLREVADAITQPELTRTIEILHASLQQQFGIQQPRILVAGLNPHAGEGGHLGSEETTIIEPVIQRLRRKGFDLLGPLPADTLFTDQHLDSADATLAMYHDQGLPVLKYSGFGQAVNITLGLPFIRTSVDHGTALGIAGSGQAKPNSLQAALAYASNLLESTSQ